MALAYLIYQGQEGDHHRFRADTGVNSLYRYRIGAARSESKGLDMVDEVVYNSPLLSSPTVEKGLRTDFSLDIPASLFSRENRFVQLYSYRDAEGNSPAASAAINVQPLLKDVAGTTRAFSTEIKIMNEPIAYAQNITTNYREKPVSQAMFWNVLLSALPAVINIAVPALKKWLGGKDKKDEKSETPDKVDQFIAALLPALQGLQAPSGSTPQGATAAQPATAASLSMRSRDFSLDPGLLKGFATLLEKTISLETLQAIGNDPEKLLKVIAHAVQKAATCESAAGKPYFRQGSSYPKNGVYGKGYPGNLPGHNGKGGREESFSLAKNTPDLTAQLPALLALLPRMAAPDGASSSDTQRLVESLIAAMLKMKEEDNKAAILATNPNLTESERLLLSMSRNGVEQTSTAMRFRLHPGVTLHFVESSAISFHGKSKAVYVKNGDISIPLRIDSVGKPEPDQVIPKAIVQLIIQDGGTMKPLLEKRFRLREIRLGQSIPGIVLTKEDLQILPSGKDLNIEASFVWPSTRDGKNVGSFKNHHILLTDGYLFDRMGESVQTNIPLNDVQRHRAFWHKIWEGTYNSSRWELEVDCKYYHTLGTSDRLGKMETKARKMADNVAEEGHDPERRKVSIHLKSGMEWSVEVLNALLLEVSMPLLTPAQLSALKPTDFASYFQQAARTQVDFRGRSGEAIALWVYPEVMLHRMHLLRVSEANALGQVVRTEPEEVVFPHPGAVHFIGTKTEH